MKATRGSSGATSPVCTECENFSCFGRMFPTMRYIVAREDLVSVAPRVEKERKRDEAYDGQVPSPGGGAQIRQS